MADFESTKHKPTKWNLLLGIKSTVNVLLANRRNNVWSTYGGLTRIIDDLEKIFRHGLKPVKGFFGELNDYDILLKSAGFLGVKYTGKTWLKNALLQHTLEAQLSHLMLNKQLMNEYYQESAYLRSADYCQALCMCLQAIQFNNPDILTELNHILEQIYQEEQLTNLPETQSPMLDSIMDEYQGTDNSSTLKESFDNCIFNEEDENDVDFISDNDLERRVLNHEIISSREKVYLRGVNLTDSKKHLRNINEGVLAQVALSAAMENDGHDNASPSSFWFEGKNVSTQRKRSSSETDLPNVDDKKTNFNKELTNHVEDTPTTDYKSKKAIGHSRSKSDGTRLIKASSKRQQSVKEIQRRTREKEEVIAESQRLSSSLPESSVAFYNYDPLSPNEEVSSFASRLALQDLSSCELEKENAHFSISEALIQAIEQMKCDKIIASEDEDEDDEEIQSLKLEIERRRLEKRREKLRLEPAFSDETPKTPSNNSSNQSTLSSSSKSSIIDVEDIGPEWDDIAEEHITSLSKLSASETTLVPESILDVSSLESSASPPLSAEAVAKSLLQKFANKKHPAASELQWLVSENDVPQTLLPLPKAFSVDPEEGVRDVEEINDHRRKSLPCRIRGNFEWAPPRFQIIFHIPPQTRRRQQMSEQNYRCVGCGMQVDPGYMKRFRYCHYLGKYFCSSCHHNSLMVIPARVLHRWDFRKYEVSKFACDLLNKIHGDPLFNVKDLNSSLYHKIRVLDNIKNLRKQLYFLKSFAQTCRKSEHLQDEFSRIPNHILNEEHLFSMQDLIQVKSGELLDYFKSLLSKSLAHVGDCPLCQAKGFICEYCRKGDDIIFPFELDRVIQCSKCRASFHKDCYVQDKCPKCERIRIRKSLLAAPLPQDT